MIPQPAASKYPPAMGRSQLGIGADPRLARPAGRDARAPFSVPGVHFLLRKLFHLDKRARLAQSLESV